MNAANSVSREKLSFLVKQMIEASRGPVAHTRRTINIQLSHLDSVRLFRRISTQTTQDYVNKTALVFRNNIVGRNENENLIEQLNQVHDEGMAPEERRFLEQGIEYHRRRLLKGKW